LKKCNRGLPRALVRPLLRVKRSVRNLLAKAIVGQFLANERRRAEIGPAGKPAVYKPGHSPAALVLALENRMKPCAESVRRSAQELMQAHWHSLPRASCARARQFGPWQGYWHSPPCTSSAGARQLGHVAQHPAYRLARARGSAPRPNRCTLAPTTLSCRLAPAQRCAPDRNRYVEAPTPWQPLGPCACSAGPRTAASTCDAHAAGSATFPEPRTLANGPRSLLRTPTDNLISKPRLTWCA
jgi:hypothetical protein